MMDRRADHLINQGLAERQTRRRQLLALTDRHAAPAEVRLSARSSRAEDGRPFTKAGTGEYVAGTYRQRFALASAASP